MKAHIESWSTSGLNKVSYCKAHNLTHQKFHYWLKKYKDQNESTESSFKQIKPDTSISSIEIHYPSGIIVKLNEPVTFQMLKSLL